MGLKCGPFTLCSIFPSFFAEYCKKRCSFKRVCISVRVFLLHKEETKDFHICFLVLRSLFISVIFFGTV